MPESTVHMILAAVERLAPESCGAFVIEIENSSVGTVFVERNRVCWAAYHGLSKRLRGLLREQLAALGDDGKPEAMRRALKQHTIESLLALPQEQGEVIEWIEHRKQGYQPRFTFSPAELFVAVNSILYSSEAAGTELALSTVDESAHAASFVQGDGGGLVAIRLHGPHTTIADLDELGDWAEAAFGVTRGFSREVMKHALAAVTDHVRIAWRTSHHHTHAAVLERGESLDRLVASLEGGSLPAVVSRVTTTNPTRRTTHGNDEGNAS